MKPEPLTNIARVGWLPGLLFALAILSCSAEKTLEVHNACFRVEALVQNPGALGLATVTFHVRQAAGQQLVHSQPLVIEGSGYVAARFLADSLLLVKPDAQEEEPATDHVILRLPMQHMQRVSLGKPPDNPFSKDSIYTADTLGLVRISYRRAPDWPEVRVVWYENLTLRERSQAILLAPVEDLSGRLLDEGTLELTVRWQDVQTSDRIIVRLPRNDGEEFEYSVVQQ